MNNIAKKKIVIDALMDEKWIGGLYYTRNILFSILQNEYIKSNYEIIVHSFKGNESVFADFKEVKQYYSMHFTPLIDNTIDYVFRLKLKPSLTFPLLENRTVFKQKHVCWIPDFQHKYYPEYFSKEELEYRDKKYNSYIGNDLGIVFSSNNSLKDFKKFYSSEMKNVYVVPFVSFIEPIIRELSIEEEDRILAKYGLYEKKYTCIMNQFWQHKNHKIVFEAIDYLVSSHDENDLDFVFTGKMEDYRKPEYIEYIKSFLKNPSISSRIKLLGYINRKEQIAIMKNAEFILQPSLFEGWGTVVEDAKVLDKTIILSDIPVHNEQKNEKCILFNPHDAKELADLLYKESKKRHFDDVEKGIEGMYKRAKEYSNGFERLLNDIDNV